MMKPMRKNSNILNILNNSLIDLPSPSNISYMWNFGSLLGMCLMIQILTGIFLVMHYCPDINLAFNSISHICRDTNYGWLIRTIHANGASMFFICLYMHMGRGIYYSSYKYTQTWTIGIIILLMSMATAFLGYVLPWGQMSFWGATVITNLFSAIPYIGNSLVYWLWGGFAVDNATLSRFFSLHYLLPFIITSLILIHLMYLHQTGSSNPLGVNSNLDKIPFHPYFSYKDLLGMMMFIFMFIFIILIMPYNLSDPDNFIPANPLSTPAHIQPEWYFLFAYTILRSIPNKLGGVMALLFSILIFFFLPFMNKKNLKSNHFYFLNKYLFWFFVTLLMILTCLSSQPVESPFIFTGQMCTILYFSFFFINSMTFVLWDFIIFK